MKGLREEWIDLWMEANAMDQSPRVGRKGVREIPRRPVGGGWLGAELAWKAGRVGNLMDGTRGVIGSWPLNM